jgi:alpha-L-rhamnosidase
MKMKVADLKTNHIVNPLGFELGKPHFSYIVTDTQAKKQVAARIVVALDEEMTDIIEDTGKSSDISSLDYELKAQLKPRTRYYWNVEVFADNGETAKSETAWFETAKMEEGFLGVFITPVMDPDYHPVMKKTIKVEGNVKRARAYVCGLGLFEMQINGKKVGDEHLTPYCNAYDKWLQYITFDIGEYLNENENEVDIFLGNGWYKGKYGFKGTKEVYGSQFELICDIVIDYEDGTTQVIGTDPTWQAKRSKYIKTDIYDGETYDATFEDDTVYKVRESGKDKSLLTARYSLPVIVKKVLKPVELIITPKGEKVLDMGQNMVGYMKFTCREKKGTKVHVEHGEILQGGNFYNDNLRTAKAEFTYISDGTEREVWSHFTFYGFRYVKIEGIEDLKLEDFEGDVIYSDLEETGFIETSNPKINRLFLNTLWGQRGNFVDIPTDCPQRDERMGWTGDAQVFSGTACFNMDSFQFFRKYGHDLYEEQKARNGLVHQVIPAAFITEVPSTAWGEAATVIPWVVYLNYGNKSILEDQFDSMKGWVDFMRREAKKNGDPYLWTTGWHYGDWLALDGGFKNRPVGGTEMYYISSAFFYYSSTLVAKAAKVLGKTEEQKEYEDLAAKIKKSIQNEYFTSNGRLALDNQTAYVLALYMDLAPEGKKARVAADLRNKLNRDGNYLKTGFVGTPYLCRVLTENGCNDLSYTLLLNDQFPSWLYEVNMGATTIWERWNSVLPDGSISDTGMNSLNHYAYGSIVEWMYRSMAGINMCEDVPGFKKAVLAPKPDDRIDSVSARIKTASGLYETGWKITKDGKMEINVTIPFDCDAKLILPYARKEEVLMNGALCMEGMQKEDTVELELTSGTYRFTYPVMEHFYRYYSTNVCVNEIFKSEEAKKVLLDKIPSIALLDHDIYIQSIREMAIRDVFLGVPRFPMTDEMMDELDAELGKIKRA